MMTLYRSLIITALTILIACTAIKQNMIPVVQFGHSAAAVSVAFSPDGRFMISGSDDQTVKLWEVSTGREIRTFKGIGSNVTAVAFSPDGLAALSGYMNGTLALWEVSTGQKMISIKTHSRTWIQEVAFSADGQKLISCGNDRNVKVYHVSSGMLIKSFGGKQGTMFSKKARWL